MRFYSTNKISKSFRLPEVLSLGLAPDGGLFMPNYFPKLQASFFKKIPTLDINKIAFAVIKKYVKEIPAKELKKIVREAFNFPAPLKLIEKNLYVLELFHGPTMAFKDFGARFLAKALSYFLEKQKKQLNIIVATSGDTGSAVASGFFKNPGIKVFILYPSGKVSSLQEKQLTTYGQNVTALEVKGTFDDCQKLAKQVLCDKDLNRVMPFSSANSISFGRLLPQTLYYFWAYKLLKNQNSTQSPVMVVPSGNFGNLFAGLMAKKIGLPIYKFVAATNSNNIVPEFLKTGKYIPKKPKKTISNAMDVGNPSNFARMLELYHYNYKLMNKEVTGYSISDAETKATIKKMYEKTGYILDPHTAVGVAAAKKYRSEFNEYRPIVVLGTAHPAKFKEIVEPVIKRTVRLPAQLQLVVKKIKHSIVIPADLKALKKVLLSRLNEQPPKNGSKKI